MISILSAADFLRIAVRRLQCRQLQVERRKSIGKPPLQVGRRLLRLSKQRRQLVAIGLRKLRPIVVLEVADHVLKPLPQTLLPLVDGR